MSASPAQAAWVARVLGLGGAPGPAEGKAAPGWSAAFAGWRAATAAVDAQIASLQAALRAAGSPVLQEIAEYGLNGLTGNHRVRLTAALQELGAAPGPKLAQAAPKLGTLLQEFEAFLAGPNPKLDVVEDNPFGVPVGIRATLVPALRALAAATAADPG
ncbi:hypothetical protein [Siccirubricoccus phaeus]|uniref:hypothetical protein n=1 Tax=Siccirubricoccus phaeus TaxID=2595053 RepID=UPI0011F20CBE|nr:hypothetical protein [Siccirubricoccus phaeus]